MVGRILLSAVSCSLIASLAVVVTLDAAPQSPAPEPGQSQTDTQDIDAVRRAAEQGEAKAQRALGRAYDLGRGVPQDYAEALKWYRLSADQGNGEAQANLGFMYHNGEGVAQDYLEALKWYRLSADQGNGEAQANLGSMYHNGHGVPQDYAEALRWYRLSADQGLAVALHNLGSMYLYRTRFPGHTFVLCRLA